MGSVLFIAVLIFVRSPNPHKIESGAPELLVSPTTELGRPSPREN